MANKYFNVKDGIKTGNITLDATSGNANIGNLSVANLANTANLFVRTYLQSNLVPYGNGVLSLANNTNRFKDVFLTGNVDINGYQISANATTANFSGNIVANGANFNSVAVNTSLVINSTTDSTSTVTGSVTVAGGVGIVKNLTVGGDINMANGGTTPLGAIGFNASASSFEFKFN
jgi:hypothetical protein